MMVFTVDEERLEKIGGLQINSVIHYVIVSIIFCLENLTQTHFQKDGFHFLYAMYRMF